VSNYDRDPLDLRGQEADKARRDAEQKLARENEDADLKWLMGRKQGRRFLWHLLEKSRVFQLSFNTNALSMAFAEGNRNFGLITLAQIHMLCPELYPVMVKENTENARNNDDGNGKNSN
jgi:hypothetical protein